MQLLIATGSQRLCPRRKPVVPSHYREVEVITNLLPHRHLLRTLVEGEVPAMVEFPHRISGEHSKGQWRRCVRLAQPFDQLKHRTCLLHRLAARKRQTFDLPCVVQSEHAPDDVTCVVVGRRAFERMACLIKAAGAIQRATLKPEHCPPPRAVCAADWNESMNQHGKPAFIDQWWSAFLLAPGCRTMSSSVPF